MKLSLNNLGRRFNKEWIFRGLNAHIDEQTPTVIFGHNGSGKSTLLKLISASELPSEGEVIFTKNKNVIPADKAYQFIGIAAPYMDLPDAFTLRELLQFNQQFKPFIDGLDVEAVAEKAYLQDALNKQIKVFSSGMKQRLKLALALFTENDLLLLDEPTSNMDEKGVNWYQENVAKAAKGRTIVICSNAHAEEHFFCTQEIDINQYK
jgi:ABC-type multidrug transport system ATPase subunit